MYASITGLEKYTNQVWWSPYFAWVSAFSLKPADFLENKVHNFERENLCNYY